MRLLLCLTACVALGVAEDITISPGISAGGFRRKLKDTSSGDVVTVQPGTYTFTSSISIESDHVTIQAAPGGQVFLDGGLTGFRIKGDHITIKGFSFKESGGDKASKATVFDIYGSHNTITDCDFDGYNSRKYINIRAGTEHNTVTKCNFARRPVDVQEGNLIQVNAHASVIGYHKISYCSFQDIDGDCDARRAAGFTGSCSLGDFGNEPIRLGLSSQHYPLAAVVEYCYFNNVGKADGESISIKSHNNVLRYNTFENNPLGMMVFRSGGDNVAYGNFFLNSGGVRIKEQNNVWLYNNYFDQSDCHRDDCAPPLELNYVRGYTTGITVAFNTFHKVERIKMGKDKWGDDVDEVAVFANNIFSAPSERKIFRDDNMKTTFTNNVVNEKSNSGARYKGQTGLTDAVVDGITEGALYMEDRGDGIWVPTENSPAVDAATEDYPAIADMADVEFDQDIDDDVFGLSRPVGSAKDIGASEFGAAGDDANKPLTLNDVGPDFLRNSGRRVTSLSAALEGTATLSVTEAEEAAMRDFGEVTVETLEAEATMKKYGVRMAEETAEQSGYGSGSMGSGASGASGASGYGAGSMSEYEALENSGSGSMGSGASGASGAGSMNEYEAQDNYGSGSGSMSEYEALDNSGSGSMGSGASGVRRQTVMVQTAAETQMTHFTAVLASAGAAVLVLAAVAVRKNSMALPATAASDGIYGTHALRIH